MMCNPVQELVEDGLDSFADKALKYGPLFLYSLGIFMMVFLFCAALYPLIGHLPI